MRKTSSSLPDSYPGLSGSFFIDTSFSGRAGCHPVTPEVGVVVFGRFEGLISCHWLCWQVEYRDGMILLRTLIRTFDRDFVLRARVVPGIGTSVGSEEGPRVAYVRVFE